MNQRLQVLIPKWILACLLCVLFCIGAFPAAAQEDTLIAELGRGTISDYFWHPDGSRFYVRTATNILYVYDRATLTETHHLTGIGKGSITASGRWLTLFHTDTENWSIVTPNNLDMPILSGVKLISFSPDERLLLTQDADKQVKLFDGATLTLLDDISHPLTLEGFQWSPDSNRLAEFLPDKTTQIWNIALNGAMTKGVILPAPYPDEDYIYRRWSPDSSRLAQHTSQGAVTIYNVANGEITLKLDAIPTEVVDDLGTGQDTYVYGLWHPDAKKFVRYYRPISSDTTQFLFIDAQSGELLTQMRGVISVFFSSDGKYMSLGDGVYDSQTFEKITVFYGAYFSWNPSGSLAALSDMGSWLTIYDTQTWQEKYTVETALNGRNRPSFGGPLKLSWSSDSLEFLIYDFSTGDLQLIDGETGQTMWRTTDYQLMTDKIVYNPTFNLAAVPDLAGNIHIFDMLTGEHLHRLTGITSIIGQLEWQPNGTLLAAKSKDAIWSGEKTQAAVWNAITGQRIETIEDIGEIQAMLWRPDGHYLAISTSNQLIIQYPDNTVYMQLPENEIAHSWSSSILNFSPDSRFIVREIGVDGETRQTKIMDADSFEQIAPYLDNPYGYFQWSSDNTKLRILITPLCQNLPCPVYVTELFDTNTTIALGATSEIIPTFTSVYMFTPSSVNNLVEGRVLSADGKNLLARDREHYQIWAIGDESATLLETHIFAENEFIRDWETWSERQEIILSVYPLVDKNGFLLEPYPLNRVYSPDKLRYATVEQGIFRLYRVDE